VGQAANLCIINPEKEWTFSTNTMLRHGKNTPFSGWHFKGKVIQTLLEGRAIFTEKD